MIKVRNVTIGEGKPKICVPICGANESAVKVQAMLASDTRAEIVEWRADTFENYANISDILNTLKLIRKSIGDKALMFTFRTKDEGGKITIRDEEYIALLKLVCDSRLVDILDVECCVSEYRAGELIPYAKRRNVAVIGTNVAEGTMTSAQEIDFRLRYMNQLGADISRIQLTIQQKKNVHRMMNDIYTLTRDFSFPVSISVEGPGSAFLNVISEYLGNDLITGKLPDRDRPDQMDVYRLQDFLDQMHEL